MANLDFTNTTHGGFFRFSSNYFIFHILYSYFIFQSVAKSCLNQLSTFLSGIIIKWQLIKGAIHILRNHYGGGGVSQMSTL